MNFAAQIMLCEGENTPILSPYIAMPFNFLFLVSGF